MRFNIYIYNEVHFSKSLPLCQKIYITCWLRTETPKLSPIILRLSISRELESIDYHDVYKRHT